MTDRPFFESESCLVTHPAVTVPPAVAAVKSKIVAAGIRYDRLAAEARITPQNLNNHLTGIRHSYDTQWVIWMAFKRLTGQTILLQEFWGKLKR